MVLSATLRAGLGAFTKSIASELAPHGITANVLCPGGVLTDRLKDLVKTRSERGVSYDSLINNQCVPYHQVVLLTQTSLVKRQPFYVRMILHILPV